MFFGRFLERPDMQSDRAGSIQTYVGPFRKSHVFVSFLTSIWLPLLTKFQPNGIQRHPKNPPKKHLRKRHTKKHQKKPGLTREREARLKQTVFQTLLRDSKRHSQNTTQHHQNLQNLLELPRDSNGFEPIPCI